MTAEVTVRGQIVVGTAEYLTDALPNYRIESVEVGHPNNWFVYVNKHRGTKHWTTCLKSHHVMTVFVGAKDYVIMARPRKGDAVLFDVELADPSSFDRLIEIICDHFHDPVPAISSHSTVT